MKIILAIFLFLYSFAFVPYANAQQNFSSLMVRVRHPQNALGVADTLGNLAYIFEGHKQYQISILNSSGLEIRNMTANRIVKGRKEIIIGAVLNDSSYIAYFYSKKFGNFSSLTINLNTSNYHFKDIKQMSNQEQFLRAFTTNDKFYILTVPKQKNILNIYECADGSNINSTSYGIEMAAFYAMLSSNNNLLNEASESPVGIETVRSRLDNNIKSAYPKKKLYYEKDQMYLLFDEPNSTHLFNIDLTTKQLNYKKLNFTLQQGNNSSEKRGNSFLYDNKIFRATISPEMMNITIIDLDSIRLVNTFNIYPDKDITIANGPMILEGGTNAIYTDERVLHKTRQYFQRVLDGNISIAANRVDSGRVELEVGSYEEVIVRNPSGFGAPGFSFGMGMGMGMGGFGMGSPYGFGSPFGYGPGFGGYPGYYPYNNFNGGSSVRLRMVYFKSLLKDPDYRHVAGETPIMLREKINEYIASEFKNNSPDLYTITSLNEEKLLMGYYLKHKNKFEIIQFNKINKLVTQ